MRVRARLPRERPSVRPSAANRITLLKRQPFAGRGDGGGGGDPAWCWYRCVQRSGGVGSKSSAAAERQGDRGGPVRKGSRGGYSDGEVTVAG